MKQTYFTFAFFAAIAFSACSSDDGERIIGDIENVSCRSCVPAYCTSDGFDMGYRYGNKDNKRIYISWGAKNDYTISCAPELLPYIVGQENDFMEYATRNNDLTYTGVVSVHVDPIACSDNFKAIHVVAADDWDEKHPAGTLLDELFTFRASSYAPYIRSGYDNDKFDPNNYNTIISKRFSELTADDLCILDIEMVFIAESAPADKQKIHELTFTFVTDEGVEKPTTIRYSWADGVIE